jgi:hypothetical protein
MFPSSTPHLHLHWLVVALHLVTLPPPLVLSSRPPPLNALLPYITLATPTPVCLLFSPTGCCDASCSTSASNPLAHPPLHLHLLLHLVFVCPDWLLCCLPSTCNFVTATLNHHSPQWLVVASYTSSVVRHPLLSSLPPSFIVQSTRSFGLLTCIPFLELLLMVPVRIPVGATILQMQLHLS